MHFYKKNKKDKVWWVEDLNTIGVERFSFDKKRVYYLFGDYPSNLSKVEKDIFDKENPFWADFFK